MHTPRRGFTLVETVVAVGVFGIFFSAIALILQQVLENVGTTRVRTVALAIAQEKMEVIRNLPYANVGTVGGIPSGPIQQTEIITINNQQFTVTTSIFFIDDVFDTEAPTDTNPADYKRVRVQITWGGVYPSRQPVTLVTNIVPNGLETVSDGGTLVLQILNSQGQPVSNATVTITNTVVTPNINTSTLSDTNGRVSIPAAPACVTCYQISVARNGYSSDQTYGTQQVANPLQPHITVLTGQVSHATFSIDQTSSITIYSVGSKTSGYPVQPNVLLTLRGSKIIGYDTQDNPVLKFSFSTNTGGGSVGIPKLEWDNYTVDLSNSNYSLAGSNPPFPITINPNTTNSVTIVTEPKYNNSILMTIKNQIGEPQASAAASVTDLVSGLVFNKTTAATGSADFGQAFFNNLAPSQYLLIATVSGYQIATASMTLNTNQQATLVVSQ